MADDLDWHASACNLCYVNCGVELGVAGRGQAARIVRVRGDKANPKSRGYLCNKAQAIPAYVHHRDRLTSPLRRRPDGGHEAVSWDVAIAEIAARLRTVRDAHGGGAIALYGGGGQGNHAGGAYATALLRGLGSRHVFNALAHHTRRHVLQVLAARGGTLTAGELSSRFSHSWPTTSRHLGILLDAGVVSVVTNGRQRHYRIERQKLGDVLALWLNSVDFELQPSRTPPHPRPAAETRPSTQA